MNNFLDREFLANPIRDYLWVIAVIFLVWLLNRFISKYIAILLAKGLKRAWKSFDQEIFISLIVQPLGTFLVITASTIALYRLTFPEQLNVTIYRYPLQMILLAVVKSIQVITFIWLLLRIIDFIATILEAKANQTPHQSDNQLIVFFRDFLKVIVGIIGIMMILHFAFSYDVGNLLTGLSIVGAAIALALRESLENLIASFVIFFDKPFTLGDFVKVQNVAGNIEKIGLRSTRVRTTDKSFVTVPNKQMVDSILDNVSLRSQIRGEINLFLHLQTQPAKIQLLIDGIKNYIGTVQEIQASNVLFNDIRASAFVVFIEFFTPAMEWSRFTAVKQKLNFHILQLLELSDIKISTEGKDLAVVV